MSIHHTDHRHRLHRSGWLRAAVLGANDGIVSIASLLIGLAAAGADQTQIMLAGASGLTAGAMSMAAGEYVSVKSQEETEQADLQMEAHFLANHHEAEQQELTAIYEERGLDKNLAAEVARQLMAHNALEAHARDEIGISAKLSARPLQAAFWSGAAFTVGGLIPTLAAAAVAVATVLWLIPILAIVLLAVLGATAAFAGGASPLRGAARVCFWGTLAMTLTAVVGKLFGIAV
jgi:VIT1/CCC1 family predicted Fe2+/Mn2+ transporter